MANRLLDQQGQVLETRFHACAMIDLADARRHILCGHADLGAASDRGQQCGDRHCAGIRRIIAFELDRFDDLLVGHKLDEPNTDHIGIRRCLPAAAFIEIAQFHPIAAAEFRTEFGKTPLHAGGRAPFDQNLGIDMRTENGMRGGDDDTRYGMSLFGHDVTVRNRRCQPRQRLYMTAGES